MKLIPSGDRFRVISNRGEPLHTVLHHCCVVRTAGNKYIVIRVTSENRQDELNTIEKDMQRRLKIQQGAWDQHHKTLVVRLERRSCIVIGGERVGLPSDVMPGRMVHVKLTLSKAWKGGYVWSVDNLELVPEQ